MATGGNGRGNPTEPKPQGLFAISPPFFLNAGHKDVPILFSPTSFRGLFSNGVNGLAKKEKTQQSPAQWIATVVLLSFVLSIAMSLLTSFFVDSASLLIALFSLIVLILLGIVTDMIGTAVTSADEGPFIAMAAKRINGAKQALRLIRKAERVSSLLCDVAGDIVGIVSGTAGSVIAFSLVRIGFPGALASVLMTASISAFMIGGKAYGKGIAIANNGRIVLSVGRAMAFFERRNIQKKKNSRGGRG